MRTLIIVLAFLVGSAPSVILGQVPAPPPTRVAETGFYECPAHADVQATWPARCPLCQAVLKPVPSSAFTPVSLGSWNPQQDQEWRQRMRRNEQWREWGQRNEELRQQARRNAELRGQARRNEELGQPPPTYGYPPIQGYAYPSPYNYQYNPRTGRYEYLSPGPGYPYGGYRHNPNPGERYYNPNADQYYYNPNMGHYFYNPYTGQYMYVNPRYTFTHANIGPGIDMDTRRREEDEEARKAQQEQELRDQARRNAELWEPYRHYYPPGGYPYTYAQPGYAYQYPYNYYYNPNTGQYEYRNPAYAYPYGAYSCNPGTGQYSYNPNAGQYSYNPNTGQYQYVNPGDAYPNRGSEKPRERQEQERR